MAEYVNPRAQACQNCVKAKAKCYGHTNGRCERCNRLSKECVMQAPVVRKRKAGKSTHQAQAERIAELEARLDSLVSVLDTSQCSSLRPRGASPVLTNSTGTPSDNASSTSHVFHAQQAPEATQAYYTTPTIPLPIPHPSVAAVEDCHELESTSLPPATAPAETPTDPDELLNDFRQNLARVVPFVLIPAHVTAATLSRENPFLYQAVIFGASYYDSAHQVALGQEFVKHLTEQIYLGKRTLDMLQGLLVYLSWYNALFEGRSHFNILLGLVLSLVVDLHLYLPAAGIENHEKFLDEMKVIISCNQVNWRRGIEPSRAEKRIILGCFYLFSSGSWQFSRLNPIQWCPYIQHCHEEILSTPEHENDTYLAHLCAIQRISEDTRHSGIRRFPSQPRTWSAAMGVQFKLLMSELQRFKASLPRSLQHDVIMLMHYHSLEMYLFEVSFSMPPTTLAHTPTLQRADIMLMCLKAVRSLSDVFFSIDFKPYLHFCPWVKEQICFAMMTLSQLSLFRADDWDGSNVESWLDLPTLIDRLVRVMEDASAKYDKMEDIKPWLQFSRRMRQVKVRFEFLLASEKTLPDSTRCLTQDQNETTATLPSFLDQFDLFDDEFWQSLPNDAVMMQ
ncbi:hypothetical protein EG329_001283 [Mollisiaceae sp. DMI_Dod_QoI]|nr:hypothetical protein EG329_001283 [Helotiales sp. DMI_Dod_QoI]